MCIRDSYWFGTAGAGDDVITDFVVGEDLIAVASKFNLTWAELQAATVDNADGHAVITLAHPSDASKDATITLDGVAAADLVESAFLL